MGTGLLVSHHPVREIAMRGLARKQKIIYVIDSVPSIESTTMYQRISVLSEHFDLLAISLYSGMPPKLAEGLRFERYPWLRLRWLAPFLFPIWCSFKIIQQKNSAFSFVFTSPQSIPLITGFLIRELFGTKWIADIYDLPELALETSQKYDTLRDFVQFKVIRLLNSLVHRILRHADLVLCTLLPEALQEYRISRKRLVPLTNGILPDLLSEPDPDEGNLNDKKPFTVLYLGYVLRSRGMDTVVEAAEMLKNAYPEIQWILAGPSKGADARWLSKEITEHKLFSTLQWIGEVPHQEALDHIRASSVCLFTFPRHKVTDFIFPVKIFEYMALGKPIVSTNLRGVNRILRHESNALLFEPGDPDGLARAVERLFRDPILGHRIGNEAKENVKAYSWSAINEKLLSSLPPVA